MRIVLPGPSRPLGSGITEANKAASGPVELVFGIVGAARCFQPGNFDLATSVASLSALTFDALINRTGLPQNRRCRKERRRSLFSLP